jgi:phosphoribosyl 1,2-cyclic phosphodiesterase
MIEFTILGSGSGGNAALIRSARGLLLVDAGLSASQLISRMQAAGVEPADLHGILLTHEHGDHCRGLKVFTQKYKVPVLVNAQTREVLRDDLPAFGLWKIVPCGGCFEFAGFQIETFRVPHDAVDPMGFVLRAGGTSLGFLSDLGHATTLVRSKMPALDALFIEANYDAAMLANDTKRPWSTRQRIASRHGHLSNDQTAELVHLAASRALQRIVLGHLSRDCNSPEAALSRVHNALTAAHCEHTSVECARQDTPTSWFSVIGNMPPLVPEGANCVWEQAELF